MSKRPRDDHEAAIALERTHLSGAARDALKEIYPREIVNVAIGFTEQLPEDGILAFDAACRLLGLDITYVQSGYWGFIYDEMEDRRQKLEDRVDALKPATTNELEKQAYRTFITQYRLLLQKCKETIKEQKLGHTPKPKKQEKVSHHSHRPSLLIGGGIAASVVAGAAALFGGLQAKSNPHGPKDTGNMNGAAVASAGKGVEPTTYIPPAPAWTPPAPVRISPVQPASPETPAYPAGTQPVAIVPAPTPSTSNQAIPRDVFPKTEPPPPVPTALAQTPKPLAVTKLESVSNGKQMKVLLPSIDASARGYIVDASLAFEVGTWSQYGGLDVRIPIRGKIITLNIPPVNPNVPQSRRTIIVSMTETPGARPEKKSDTPVTYTPALSMNIELRVEYDGDAVSVSLSTDTGNGNAPLANATFVISKSARQDSPNAVTVTFTGENNRKYMQLQSARATLEMLNPPTIAARR